MITKDIIDRDVVTHVSMDKTQTLCALSNRATTGDLAYDVSSLTNMKDMFSNDRHEHPTRVTSTRASHSSRAPQSSRASRQRESHARYGCYSKNPAVITVITHYSALDDQRSTCRPHARVSGAKLVLACLFGKTDGKCTTGNTHAAKPRSGGAGSQPLYCWLSKIN